MQVQIVNYRVRPASAVVDVEMAITLPTGNVMATIVATEATLSTNAAANNRSTWDESDLVAVVAGVFAQLAQAVSIAA